MFYCSISDLTKLDQFKGKKQFEIIHPDNDFDVLAACYPIGLDIDAGYTYRACQHRNLQNKIVVGIRLEGSYRTDSEFRRSICYTPEVQILSNIRQDISLVQELCKMSGSSFNYGNVLDADAPEEREEDVEGCDEIMMQVKQLQMIIDEVRGSPYNDYGNLKSWKEWNT